MQMDEITLDLIQGIDRTVQDRSAVLRGGKVGGRFRFVSALSGLVQRHGKPRPTFRGRSRAVKGGGLLRGDPKKPSAKKAAARKGPDIFDRGFE